MATSRKSSRTASNLLDLNKQQQVQSRSMAAQSISIDRIRLPLKQPRRYFNSEKQAQLVASVKEYGILEPLLVRPLQDGEFELVAGERRLRAAKEAGLIEVPVVAQELSDQQALQISLIENLQREDLNPIEETEAILTLLTLELNTTSNDVVSVLNQAHNARKRGQSLTHNVMGQLEQIDRVFATIGRFTADSFRANRLPLLNLPVDLLEALRQGSLTYTKAQLIARVKPEDVRQLLLKEAVTQNLTLSALRTRVKQLNNLDREDPEKRFSQMVFDRTTVILKHLKQAKVWQSNQKRKKAEKLLAELEKLVES
jgi:ParB family transcriptional regulator, chromosome partitioning protein